MFFSLSNILISSLTVTSGWKYKTAPTNTPRRICPINLNFTFKPSLFLLNILQYLNTFFLRIGRQLAWIAILLMVMVILLQVFFRYVLNNALPWPDEVARFLMLWMTALIAPSAYRWGGFVSIDMIIGSFTKLIGNLISLILLILRSFL